MQRGILILTREELIELVKYINFEKFNIAKDNINYESRVFVNEDELESILDEIGGDTQNDIIRTISNKISELLISFRNS